jgi:hypothetical protein
VRRRPHLSSVQIASYNARRQSLAYRAWSVFQHVLTNVATAPRRGSRPQTRSCERGYSAPGLPPSRLPTASFAGLRLPLEIFAGLSLESCATARGAPMSGNGYPRGRTGGRYPCRGGYALHERTAGFVAPARLNDFTRRSAFDRRSDFQRCSAFHRSSACSFLGICLVEIF